MRVWDVRNRKYMRGKGRISNKHDAKHRPPGTIRGEGGIGGRVLYVYGDLFRRHVDHRQLRDVMNIDPAKLDPKRRQVDFEHLTLRADNYLYEAPSDPDTRILWLRMYCSSIRGSVVILMPGKDCFGVGVGLLGHILPW